MDQTDHDIKNSEIAFMCRQFSSLMHAKINILDIFEALREQTSSPLMREIIDSVRRDAENGRTLATAFSRYPQVFSPFFISMIRQGELEGELDRVFEDLANHYATRLEETPDATRIHPPATDLEAAARLFQWGFIWVVLLGAFCMLGAGIIWYATLVAGLPGRPGPNILIFVAVILFLAALLFSRGRRKL